MPNTEARVFRSIWDDQDFLALPMDCKTFFFTVLTGFGMNHAGISMIPRREWTNLHPDEDTAERLQAARKVCEKERFVYIDEDTDEVLFRSYIRRDVMGGPPATFRAAMDAVCAVRSPRLREVLRGELRRLDVDKIEAKKAETSRREAPLTAYRRALAALGEPDVEGASSSSTPGLWGPAPTSPANSAAGSSASSGPTRGASSGTSSGPSSTTSSGDGNKRPNHARPVDPIGPSSTATSAPPTGDGAGDGDGESTSVGGPVGGSRARARETTTPTRTGISDRLAAVYADPDNDAPCRRHPDDGRGCRRCGAIGRNHPDGYDPRPPELIPDDQLHVDAWADPALVIAAPDEVELGDPAARQAWYRQAGADQLAERRAQARQRLGDYQAGHPA